MGRVNMARPSGRSTLTMWMGSLTIVRALAFLFVRASAKDGEKKGGGGLDGSGLL